MFEQTFVEGANTTRKASSVFVSFLIQCSLVIVGILIPLIYTETLPKTQLTGFLVAPPPPPPPPPPPAAAPVKVVKVVPRQFDAGRLTAPKQIPKDIAIIKEEDIPPVSAGVVGGVPGGVPGGAPGGVIGGIIGSVPSAAPPPPPVKEAPKPVTPKSIRVGGNVQSAKLIRQPKPVYPPWQSRLVFKEPFDSMPSSDVTAPFRTSLWRVVTHCWCRRQLRQFGNGSTSPRCSTVSR